MISSLFIHDNKMLDSGTDETKSIASCKAVSLVATDPVPDNPQQKLDTEIEIKSYQTRAHSRSSK